MSAAGSVGHQHPATHACAVGCCPLLSYWHLPAADSIRRRYPELFGSRPTSPLASASDVHATAQQQQEQSAGRPTMRQQSALSASESPMRRLLQVCPLVL